MQITSASLPVERLVAGADVVVSAPADRTLVELSTHEFAPIGFLDGLPFELVKVIHEGPTLRLRFLAVEGVAATWAGVIALQHRIAPHLPILAVERIAPLALDPSVV